MSFDLTNKNISETFQNLLQKTGSEGYLYDLTGNQVDNLTIGGTLTAHSYVTSESINNISISSGSTAFGNTDDDTHRFYGNTEITGSLVVSASTDDHTIINLKASSSSGPAFHVQQFILQMMEQHKLLLVAVLVVEVAFGLMERVIGVHQKV